MSSSPRQPVGFHVLGKQSRRSACDRCRDQKLRCVYQDPRVLSCERCQRFGVTCTYNHGSTKPATKSSKRLTAVEGRKRKAPSSPLALDLDRTGSLPSLDCPSSTSSTNIVMDSPQGDWLSSLGLTDSCFPGLSGPGSDSLDFNFDDLPEANDMLPYQPPNETRQQETATESLHRLDVRICHLLGVFDSLKGFRHALSNESEYKPMREVLGASQAFLDLITSAAFTIEAPGILLTATVYTRLLSAYSELFAYMISGLSAASGVDSLFPSPTEACFGPSPGSSEKISALDLGVDFQLVGCQVQGDVNLNLRILVETCSYMLDKLESHFRVPMDVGSCARGAWEQPLPRSVGVMDLVAIATRHDDWQSQSCGKTPISSITRNIQYLKQVLRVG